MSSDTVHLDLPDAGLVQRTLASPPFHTVDGVINFRDFGLLSLPSNSNNNEKGLGGQQLPRVRPGVLFRSGELARLTEKGKSALRDLGVTTVFDLRSASEIRKYQSATPDVEGVRFVHVPVTDSEEYDPMALAAKVAKFASDEKNAFAALYSGILENGGPAYEAILVHLRDNPGDPCLVHCTAGKDRTGVFAAIVQLLLGIPDAAIAHDYHLTTYGLAPALPALVARFQKEAIYRDNWKGFQNMGSAKKETMLATLTLLRDKYGGAEGYIKARTSLTDADITHIRQNLLIDSTPFPNSGSLSKRSSDSQLGAKASGKTSGDHSDNAVGEQTAPISALSSLSEWIAYAYATLEWIRRAVLS